jgi:hypothetical protein
MNYGSPIPTCQNVVELQVNWVLTSRREWAVCASAAVKVPARPAWRMHLARRARR